jgi:hypothetical protein
LARYGPATEHNSRSRVLGEYAGSHGSPRSTNSNSQNGPVKVGKVWFDARCRRGGELQWVAALAREL